MQTIVWSLVAILIAGCSGHGSSDPPPATSLPTTSPAVNTSASRIRGLTTLRVESPDWHLLNEGRQEPIGAQASDGGLTGGHYSVYASTDGATELHIVAWPIDDNRPLKTLLRFWEGRAEIIDVQDTTIGYSPAGGGAPAFAWWTDDRGYFVMASVTAPEDSLDLRRILVEGPIA